uniref:CAP-Gly domain-containing linker protein 1 n=1 Tax=Magallana gigas TaxID=29159 RepID=K1QD45_MAGGI
MLDSFEGAIAKSARAAGISANLAEKYAAEMVQKLPGPEGLPPPPPADDFIIGDRVWVSGTKPGHIAYIGETQFAAGEWAGVVLDNPEGKNDGSVQGVRYFQCEPKRGVFSRISKLSRTPGLTSVTPKPDDCVSESGGSTSVKANGTSHLPSSLRPTTPKPIANSRALSTSSTSLNKAGVASIPASKKPALKIGDRVLVSGTKTGTLKYIGATDFAKGDWAGVELDEKQGKNDGAVSGKRYFECGPMFGLFAPIHKVTRLTSGNVTNSMSASTPSPQSRTLMNTSLRMSRERSGSQDSVSSISSTASSVSRSRAKTSQRPSSLNLTATTQALQKALKEKEEHIEQLLKERDLERAEVARAAAQAEGQLANMRSEQDRFRDDTEEAIARLRSRVEELEKERSDLNCKLEDERRKVEDLQFQIEEEAISKDDLESQTEVDEEKLRSLEKDLKKEKERADKSEQEYFTLKAMLKDSTDRLTSTEDTNMSYLDQIEELTHKLSQAESKVKSFESSRLEEGAKRDELSANQGKKQKMQETINRRDEASNQLNSELQNLKSQLAELQRKLDASQEQNDQITEEKMKLEHQMSEMMKNSGDSSNRLSMLNDQVQEKNRKIQDLQAALSNSTQQLGKLNDEIENLKGETIRERENIVSKFEESAKTQNSQIEDLQKELSKAKSKMQKMSEDHKKDNEDALSRKIKEIEELKKQLQESIEEQERQAVQTQAHKQVLEKITMEKEALQFEKEKTEKQVKRLESERDSANTELIQARVEVSKAQSEREKFTADLSALEERLQDLGEEVEKANKARNQTQKELDEVVAEKSKVIQEKERLHDDAITTKASLQQKDMHIEELQKEVERMKGEINTHQETLAEVSQKESASEAFQQRLEESQKALTDLQKSYTEMEAERDSMKAQLTFANLVTEERTRLEDQNQKLNREVEDMQTRHSQELDELQNANTSLQSQLDNTSQLLQQKASELDQQKKQISNLQNENSSLEEYRTKVQKMENEKSEFLEKISRLENSLKEAKTNASNIASNEAGNQATSKVTEERDAALGQVEFLNSVIVDLQKKNNEFKTRLEIMESGVVTNGDGDSSMESEAPKSRAPPRLFCDICDVFDQHDTDDCPLQAMDYEDGDAPSPTHYHGDRKASRPYCDICEEFHDPCLVLTQAVEGFQAEDELPSPPGNICVSDASPPSFISKGDEPSPKNFQSCETGSEAAVQKSEGLPANYKYLKSEECDKGLKNDESVPSGGEEETDKHEGGQESQTEAKMDDSCRVS